MDFIKDQEQFNKNYIDWQKKFVAGDQNTEANFIDGTVLECDRRFYWSSNKVFNLIKSTVDRWVTRYRDEEIWGRNGAVDQLIPYQKQYNSLMNRIDEISFRLASPILCVEDGSVDIDELSEEGLGPGKILVYRQGSQCPSICLEESSSRNSIATLYEIASYIKIELIHLMENLENNFTHISDKNEYKK